MKSKKTFARELKTGNKIFKKGKSDVLTFKKTGLENHPLAKPAQQNQMIQKIELMAPTGNFESLQAAIDNHADSVYFGVEQLNMRARATVNFTMDDLQEIARRYEAKKIRTYVTLNTIIYDHDLSVVKPCWPSQRRLLLRR